MSERNKAVVLRFLEAMGANDPGTAGECFAPDGLAVAMGTSHFAGPRTREMVVDGIVAFQQMLPEGLRFTIKTVTAEGDRVVVEAQGNGVTCDGARYANNYVFVATIEGGRIRRINEYFCSKLADEVLWPVAQRMGALGETQA